MKVCRKCNARNNDKSNFCGNCGTQLGAPVQPRSTRPNPSVQQQVDPSLHLQRAARSGPQMTMAAEPTEKKVSTTTWIIVGVLVVLTLGFVGSMSGNSTPTPSPAFVNTKNQGANGYEAVFAAVEADIHSGQFVAAESKLSSLPNILPPDYRDKHDQLKLTVGNGLVDAFLADASSLTGSALEKVQAYRAVYDDTLVRLSADEQRQTAFFESARALVKSLPALELTANEVGYNLLSDMLPSETVFREKATHYRAKAEQFKNASHNSKVSSILRNYRVSKDEFNEATFYTHTNSPRYTNSRSTVWAYIGHSGTYSWLRMKTTYASKDWLFVHNVKVMVDGEVFDLTSGRFKRDHHTSIWEWQDINPSERQVTLLKKIAYGAEVKLRYLGSQYRKDVAIRQADKNALKTVLADYEKLKAL